MKELWEDFKNKFIVIAVAMFAGFLLGKVYTWDTLITDCKVLGTFRIANTAFHCKMLVP